MEDGSSVRTKVAQYFVNKKIQELASEKAELKIGDLTLLQALPQYDADEPAHDDGTDELVHDDPVYRGDEPVYYGGADQLKHGADQLEHDAGKPTQLPPFFPSGPTDDTVSWERVLKSFKAHHPIIGSPWPRPPSWYRVAIIGAGVAGLRTAMLLQRMGIPYKIFEASDRPGGRIYTYQFASKPPGNPQGKHDYYDVGAMRFPDNDANKETFKLFDELGLSSKKTEYVFSIKEDIRYYNNIKTTAEVASTAGDHFNEGIARGGMVPEEYLNKEHTDLSGKKVFGVNACTLAAYDPFRKALIDNFEKGWKELMKYDWASTRSYLTRELPNYPLSVVHWMESRNSGTGGFDRAFSEAILDSLEFNDPRKATKWWCLEGGSNVFIDAMLSKLRTPPSYNHRVTSVKMGYMPLRYCFPDFPRRPRRSRQPWFPLMKVSVSGKQDEYFTHVVSTTSFADLRTIDTERVPMTYKQRQAIRTLNYGPAVKVAIKFKTRWWEQGGRSQLGGASYTDRQSRVVVYPSYGLGEAGPGVLMVTYNWHQDASRFGALIQTSDWSKQLDPARQRPLSEQVLLDQIYGDLATLHGKGVTVDYLRKETLDYHAFDWYHNPYTMGAFAHFAPGQFSTFFADIVHPAGYGRFHFAGEVASHHHAWVAGALDSAKRAVDEILRWDFPVMLSNFQGDCGRSLVFSDEKSAEAHFLRGLFSKELENAGFD